MSLISESIFAKQINHLVNKKIQKIAIAVSGGADSMCLLSLVLRVLRKNCKKFIVITINHNLREYSILEYKSIKEKCKKESIEHIIVEWKAPGLEKNIQHYARENRYSFLYNFCLCNGVKYLFLGHNLDDRIETTLLNITRGVGIDGMAIMSKYKTYKTINVVRPLINFRKQAILEYMVRSKNNFFFDSSNKDLRFQRNKVRYLLQELEISDKIFLAERNLNMSKNFIELYTGNIFSRFCFWGRYGDINISLNIIINLHKEIIFRLFNLILKHIHQTYLYTYDISLLSRALERIRKCHQVNLTIAKCRISLNSKAIYFFKEVKFVEGKKVLKPGVNIWDGRYKIKVTELGMWVRSFSIKSLQKRRKFILNALDIQIIMTTPLVVNENQGYVLSVLDRKSIKINIKHLRLV